MTEKVFKVALTHLPHQNGVSAWTSCKKHETGLTFSLGQVPNKEFSYDYFAILNFKIGQKFSDWLTFTTMTSTPGLEGGNKKGQKTFMVLSLFNK